MTTTHVVDANDAPGATSASPFRVDVEGLRGVAVLLVVLYHSSVRVVGGGYVGVDVFFVISGFLITGTLIREVSETSTVRLPRFWARRIRRLVPALTAMIAITLAATLLIDSALTWRISAREGIAAATYTSNILFASQEGGYFTGSKSPFLHTWSLSIEEQFYLVWPVLFLLAAAMGRGARRLRVAAVLTMVVSLTSLALSVVMTQRGTPWAYLSAPTRAWEFGAGALLAFVAPRAAPIAEKLGPFGAAFGLVMIVGGAMRFDEFTEFPGYLAAVPTVGTVVVLVAGMSSTPRGLTRVLGWSPLRGLGRWSYSWYLWHWPMLILGARLLGQLSMTTKLAISTAALGVAGLSYHIVENPARYSLRFKKPTATIALGLASVLLIVGAGAAMGRLADRQLTDPFLEMLASVRDDRSDTGLEGCEEITIRGEDLCVFGAEDATHVVMLIGDSHAAQWAPAVRDAAGMHSSLTIVRARGGCPAQAVRVRVTGTSGDSPACGDFRAETNRLLEQLRPDVVVMSYSDYTTRLLAADSDRLLAREEAVATSADALGAFAAMVSQLGIPLAVIADQPLLIDDPIECLAQHRSDATCAEEAAPLVSDLLMVSEPEDEALRRNGVVEILETTSMMCDSDVCHVLNESGPIFSDRGHLATSFVLSRTQLVADLVGNAIRP